MSKHVCEGCFYWRRFNTSGTDYACHFCWETGEPRGVSLKICAAGGNGSRREEDADWEKKQRIK